MRAFFTKFLMTVACVISLGNDGVFGDACRFKFDVDKIFCVIKNRSSQEAVTLINKYQGKKIDTLLEDGRYFKTSLHIAAEKGDVAVVKALIEKAKANVDIRAMIGYAGKKSEEETALMYAAKNGHFNVVNELIDKKANVSISVLGKTALIYAIEQWKEKGKINPIDYQKIITILLPKEEKDKNALLYLAVDLRNLAFIKYLLGEGKVSASIRNDKGQTPLKIAKDQFLKEIEQARSFNTLKELKQVIEALSSKDDLKNLKDSNGNTLLHIAVKLESFQELIRLLDEGWDLSIENNQGQTPLHLIGKNTLIYRKEIESLEKTKYFTSKILNLQDKSGDTPLHLATQYKNTKFVSLFMRIEGVNPKIKNNKGETACQIAITQGSSNLFGDKCKGQTVETTTKK